MQPRPATGIVRPPRRPPGWRAPGPPPRTPRDRLDLWPAAGEDLCHLAGDWRIVQRIGAHRWSLDDLVTAWFAATVGAARPPRRFVDLGCGIGAVLLLVAWRFPEATGVGIEAQEESAARARRSVAWNGVSDRITVRHADLRDAAALPEERRFDLVTATPPYLQPGRATASTVPERRACHFEDRGGVEAYCTAAARLLAPQAWFVTCAGAGDGARVARAAADAELAIARSRSIVPRAGKAPLFAVYAMRPAGAVTSAPRTDVSPVGASAAAPITDPPLVVRDRAGGWTDEFRRVRADMGMPP